MKKNDYAHITAGFVFGLVFFFTDTTLLPGFLYMLLFALYIEGMQWVLYDHEPKLLDRLFDILGYLGGCGVAAGIYSLFSWLF